MSAIVGNLSEFQRAVGGGKIIVVNTLRWEGVKMVINISRLFFVTRSGVKIVGNKLIIGE